MKNFNEWRVDEWYPHNEKIDGKALDPSSISGAENQIRVLAANIRKFAYNPRFKEFANHIVQMTSQLEFVADHLGDGMDEVRNVKYDGTI